MGEGGSVAVILRHTGVGCAQSPRGSLHSKESSQGITGGKCQGLSVNCKCSCSTPTPAPTFGKGRPEWGGVGKCFSRKRSGLGGGIH